MSLLDIVGRYGFVEKSAMAFYADVFRLGGGLIQSSFEEPDGRFRTKPIVYSRNFDAEHGHYRLLFEDCFQEMLEQSYSYDFAITNGLTYFGRKMTLANASKMYALIIDLDGQTDETLNRFLYPAIGTGSKFKIYPLPNYVVLSGHNVHLVYVFAEPIDLFPNIKLQLKNFKYGLIRKCWNPYTSTLDEPQYQGINQGFRPIGAKTKVEGVRVRAFSTGQSHWTIEGLNEYLEPEYQVDLNAKFPKSSMSLEQAQLQFPQWYEGLNEKKQRSYWCVSRNLYEWGKRKVVNGASYHHRYFCLMFLTALAVKCGNYHPKKNPHPVSREELERDIAELRPYLDSIKPDEPMTDADIKSALECYDPAFTTFPRKDFERLTAIAMPTQRRNGRTQELHLRGARAIQEINDTDGSWRNKKGAPTKKELVLKFAEEHPQMNHSRIARELGVSRSTVIKWLKHDQEQG